jgi:hypothetical protein
MKLVRIISETPTDAADLISFLESHGFMVESGDGRHQGSPTPDFEIDLRALSVDEALSLTREFAAGDIDIFVAPGVFPETTPELADSPIFADIAPEMADIAAFAEITPEIVDAPVFAAATPELADILAFAEGGPEVADTPVEVPPEVPLKETSSSVTSPEILEQEPARIALSSRLRESFTQVLQETQLTARECLALCSAELVNGSARACEWLAQMRVLVVRKRALVETHALIARAAVKDRLRFDSASQNAWIRSAFAGAGLMIVLLALMLWKDQRLVSPTPTTVNGAASILKSTPTAVPSAEAATSVPATAVLHRRLHSDRADIDDQEVIVRHFGRPSPKRAVAIDSQSGIKHISDMN